MLIKANLKVQVNIEVQRLRGLSTFDTVPHGIFPILWLDLEAELDDNIGDLLRHRLFPLTIVQIAKWSLISLTVLLVTIGICVTATFRSNKLKDVNNEPKTTDEPLLG
ncbi:unnamed protein product [Allacma fusca]|uniref:Uncharacterized protein n=1 Tax=Allacma fusca TaxID=39272 RepID=A0A8J2LUM2_9HEXA|nr:unnamed protein product [Allacma fusca]